MFHFPPVPEETGCCPVCGRSLQHEGDLERCDEHGLFFYYGPRLLVHVSTQSDEQQKALLPWQTVRELAASPN
jgi:hypothetical protein